MYSISWKENDNVSFKLFNLWIDVLNLYDELYSKETIFDLKIKDVEYDVCFIDYKWERNDNLLGWAGGKV